MWSIGQLFCFPFSALEKRGLAIMQGKSVVPPQVSGRPHRSNRSGLATASLVLGIIAIVFFFFSWIPWIGVLFGSIQFILAILALIFGIAARNSEARGSAIAGIVLSSIVLALDLIIFFLFILVGVAILSGV